MHTDLPTTDY